MSATKRGPEASEGARVYGVVGGMGPVASAEFLKTIYELSLGDIEQEFPVVMLYSDPTFPDRTTAFLSGETDELLGRLTTALTHLRGMNASRFVLCCMTIHYLVPRLRHELSERVVSLLDVIAEAIAPSRRKHLLICSSGTRQLELFEQHERWPVFRERLVMPDAADQREIHRDLIYPLKKSCDVRISFSHLERLMKKYDVDSFVAGCSEIHLLAKHAEMSRGDDAPGTACVDPLMIIARRIAEGTL
jgi:aspartate racemase